MKKIAIVLGVAAVATLTGCRDQDYDAVHGRKVQDEPKTIETTPAPEVPTIGIVTTETKCTCAPGTKHAKPCTCGASNCTCVVMTPPAEPEFTTYIVQNGDFLSKISKKYNVTISSIKRLNNLKDDKIRVGQKLKLPGKIDVGTQAAPVATPTAKSAKKPAAPYTGATKEYVVKNGDTLGAVAYGNGLTIRQLKQLNGLTSDSLKVGQKLKVPAEKIAKETKAKVDTPVKKETKAKPEVKVEPKSEVKTPASETPAVVPATTPVAAPVNTPTPAPTPVVASTPTPATPAPATVPTTTYVVQEGEDLTRLSIDFGVSVSVIREMNNLGENDTIKPGQVLKLPAESQQ